MNKSKYRWSFQTSAVQVLGVIFAYLLISYAPVMFTSPVTGIHPLFSISAAENQAKAVKHILYINSYHPGYRWSDQVQTGIFDVVKNQPGLEIDLRVEYLDAKRYPDKLKGELGRGIAAIWKSKYEKIKFNLIIVSDQDGYNLLGKIRSDVFPGVPVVFCGVEEPGIFARNTTGLLAGTDYRANIELILKVLPGTKDIWIITDRSATGAANRKNIETIAAEFRDRVRFSYFDSGKGLEPSEIFETAERLKTGEVILYLDFYNSRSGVYVDVGDFLRELTQRAAVPVFSHVDMYMDYGVTGGVMNSGYIQGKQAAETGMRIIRGVRAEDILPAPEKSLPAFNFIKMKEFGISLSKIPSESRVINRTDRYIFQYVWYFAGGTLLIILEGILIIWFFRLFRRQRELRREAQEKEKAVRQSEAKYRTLSDTATLGIWQINNDGFTEYLNNAMCRILEVDSISDLAGVYYTSFFTPESVETILAQAGKRESGESSTYEAVITGRKGTIRNLLVSGAPLMDSEENLIGRIASIADITDLKRVEEEVKRLMQRYELVVEASGQVVYEYIVPTGQITWGRSMETVLGYPMSAINGGFEQWRELVHPDDIQWILKSLAEAEAACSFWDERYRMRHMDGHYVWIRDRGFFIPDDSGKACSQVGMLEDITRLKLSEDAMDFERRQLLSIFDSIDQIIYVSDPFTYEILFANNRLRTELGKDPIGGLCFKELQGYDKPCPFCTNDIILGNVGAPYKWEHFNKMQNQTVDIVDRIIRWPDGRDVRFEIAVDITERKRAEEALRESEERNRAMLNALPDMIFVFSRTYNFTDFRAAESNKLLMTPDSFIGKNVHDILPPELADLTCRYIDSVVSTGVMQIYQYTLTIDDKTRYFETRMVLKSRDEVLAIVRDITDGIESENEREKLQVQLLQAQKIESVGRLAGGIAHDFNNMLGAITGYSELALRKMDADNPLRRYLDEILKTAGRSADLTRQLLAFARQQVIQPKIINLNDTVEGMLAMLRRLIGENISLVWKPSPDLWSINVDPTQMDQVLANLTINARDAIKESGTIYIETMNASIDEEFSRAADYIIPGDYVVLEVTDTGSGMDRATMEKIFEPFFTTKELGHGTGLGLATVYGIIKQNKGFINVYSEKGKGTAFKIYFPGVHAEMSHAGDEKTDTIPYGKEETILLVEDEPALMDITKTLLEELNYNVISAGTPAEAIQLSATYSGEIDLLITDIVMPQMNGRELAEAVDAKRPGLKTLYMSGYTADVIARQGVIHEGVSFIQKPFTMKDIALKIREVLGKE